MLIGVAAVALAFASMTYATEWWQIAISALVLVVFATAAIIALVDRGAAQAFALGIVAVMTIYAALIINGRIQSQNDSNPEFYGHGHLATTRILAFIHHKLAVVKYVDFQTGKELLNFDPRNSPRTVISSRIETPERTEFMRTGHAWCALLLGYIGGQFARWVYLRRITSLKDST